MALVAAVADNGVIGRAGALPWRLPEDLRRFRRITLGKPVLMGRRTFEAIGQPLSGRRNLVLTRAPQSAALPAGIEPVGSIDEACHLAAEAEELCVIGGAQLYALALASGCVTRLYLTQVHGRIAGDVCMPRIEGSEWDELERLEYPSDAQHAYAMSFLVLERAARC